MLSFTSAALVASTLILQAQAHTYLVSPRGRQLFKNNVGDSPNDGTGEWSALCHLGDGTAVCCGNDKMSASQMTTYKRGDTVPTRWWRNNHVGGFIRYSIVPVDDSGSQDNFDAAENVISYECNQNGCDQTYGGESPNNWNGGDSHGNMGWSNQCSGSFKIPYHLKDGTYTMQWIWFGQGNAPSANSPFQTCVDLVIKGGPTGEQPSCPLWKGGDLSEKSKDACVFVSVTNPTYQGVCVSANACSGQYTVGVPKAIQACNDGQKLNSYPLEMVSAPNGFPDTFTDYSPSGSSSSSGKKPKSKSKSKSTPKAKDSSSTSSKSKSKSTPKKKVTTSSSRKCTANSKRSHSRRSEGRYLHRRSHHFEFDS